MASEIQRKTRAFLDLVTVPLSGIQTPGVYVTRRGDMLRIASEYMTGGRRRMRLWDSFNELTRLSEDPCESVSECRRLAAEADLPFNF